MLRAWLPSPLPSAAARQGPVTLNPARYRKLMVEELEDRTLLSQFVDFQGLRFEANTFLPSNGDQLVSGGTVNLGFTPPQNGSFVPLLNINLNPDGDNGGVLRIENTSSPPVFQITGGALDAVVQGGVPIPIWQAADDTTPVAFNVDQLLSGNGFSLTTGGTPFKVAGFSFNLTALQLQNPGGDNTADSEVLMQGTISFTALAGKTSLAPPAIEVNGGNHVIVSSAGIKLTGATFTIDPQFKTFNAQDIRTTDIGVTVTYSDAGGHDTWTFGGNVLITTQPQGTGNDPALSSVGATISATLVDGHIDGLQVSVTVATTQKKPFPLLGLPVQTDAGNPLTFTFSSQNSVDQYEVSGGLTATIKGTNTIDVNLGYANNPSQPGMIIQNGTLTVFNATLNTDFTLFGANFNTNGNGLNFSYNRAQEQFEMYGSVTVTIPNGKDNTGNKKTTTITALMGDATSPGLLIEGGRLKQINMGVTGQFNVYGLAIQAEALNCNWSDVSGQDVFELSGGVSLTQVFQISASFGTQQNPGLKIVNGQFSLTSFTFIAENLRFGAFTLQDLTVAYQTDPTQGYTLDITLDLIFPGGWFVGGTIDLVNGKVNDISLAFGANQSPIPIADTGLFLNFMSASVKNIDSPANIIVSGEVSFVYGDQIRLLGHDVNIAAFQGSFFVDKDELVLNGSGAFGALQTGTDPNGGPTYTGYLGQGEANVTLNWGGQVYKASVKVSLLDGVFDVAADFTFTGGRDNFSILLTAEADVEIPKFVPIIGGTKLAGLDFVFDYREKNGSYTGFVAAWLEVDIIWKFDVGFQYVFSPGPDHGFSLIGSKGVADIEHQISNPAPQTYTYSYTYTVPQGATGVVFKVEWPAGQDTSANGPTLSLLPPGASSPIGQNDFSTSNGIQLVPTTGSTTSQNVRVVGSSTDEDAPLAPGNYQITLTSNASFNPAPTFQGSIVYPKPTVNIASLTGGGSVTVPVSLGGTVDEELASQTSSQTHVSLYVDDSNQGYHGTLLSTGNALPVQTNNGTWNASTQWNLTGLLPVPYYLYAVINDGVNTPVFSQYSNGVMPTPPLSGTVFDPEHNHQAISGMTVYLDQNNNGTYDPGVDPTATTGPTGFYAFYATDSSGHTILPTNVPIFVGVVTPPGYEQRTQNPVTVTYDGTNPLTVDFGLAQLATISGAVFEDLNGNGAQDPGEPGAANIAIDLLDTRTHATLTTLTGSDGSYAFRNLTPGDTYQVSRAASTTYYQTSPTNPSTYSQAITSKYQVVPNNNFGVLPFAAITGSVAGSTAPGGKLRNTRTPLSGWTVQLLQGSQVVATTTTDTNGNYEFQMLKAGVYTVNVVPHPGYRQLLPYHPNVQFVSPGQMIATQGAPNSIAVSDFDGDNNVDVAVVVPGALWVYWGNGQGGYTSQKLPLAFTNPVQVVAFKPNSPTQTALAVASKDGQVQVFANTGHLQWNNEGVLWTLPAGSTFNNMVAGEFHGNFPGGGQQRDLAVVFIGTNSAGNTVYMVATMLSDAAHSVVVTNASLNNFLIHSETIPPVGLASGYINDDGHEDLVINAWFINGKLNFNPTIAYGFGNGAFSMNANAISGFLTGGPAAIADVNGDGLLDVVVGAGELEDFKFGLNAFLSQQAHEPYFQDTLPFGKYLNPSADSFPVGAALNYFAGGTNPDLLVAQQSGVINVFTNLNGGTYFSNDTRFVLTLPTGSQLAALAVADVNGDGLPDLVLADAGAGGVRILLNTSTNAGQGVTLGPGQDAFSVDFVFVPTSAVRGTVHLDANYNARVDPGEPGLAGVKVYLDVTGKGKYVPGVDPIATTAADGSYTFPIETRPVYGIGVVGLRGYVATGQGAFRSLHLDNGQTVQEIDFTIARKLIQAVANKSAVAGTILRTRVDLAPLTDVASLRFSLAPAVPAGVHINPLTGVITWPTMRTKPGNYTITVWVTDVQTADRLDAVSFHVTLLAGTRRSWGLRGRPWSR